MSRSRGKEIFFSCDIESDGPIPGPYSMLSYGLVLCGEKTEGEEIIAYEPGDTRFQMLYDELKPLPGAGWDPESLAVSGLNRRELKDTGNDPLTSMNIARSWISFAAHKLNGQPVFVAYPLGFDWMWFYWYLMNFGNESPFGHSRAIDMKTLYMAKAGASLRNSTKRNMPKHLRSTSPHTHRADDDAKEQGELFVNLMKWKP